ncbi:MAG: Bpu10I family restriction endonuclease [Ktedonobacteraceae bacterium]
MSILERSTRVTPTANLSNTSLIKLLEEIESIPYDRKSIPQESLNLANKFRTSLLSWRGQFSPELVELFLKKYSQDTSVILDPFVGSGTTLFESARRGLTCYAAEINPSAIEMASTVHFVNLPLVERKRAIQMAVLLAEECTHPFTWDLFSYQNYEQPPQQNFGDAIEASFGKMLKQAEKQPYVYNLLTNAIIRFMNYEAPRNETDFLRALQEHAAIVENLPYSRRECKAFHADARAIPLPDASIDLIITSPPYINVFNYHQNNRSAMELIGWDLLDIAKSEIGSNRKNRQNRFLTVVQYALDMLDVLKEMRRLLQPNGRAIIVMGRESNVRGLRFKNGLLVAALASGGSGFHLETRQERKFKNKFGEIIYEDILHLLSDPLSGIADDSFAHSLAKWSLLEASMNAEEEVRNEALNAWERAINVQKSPLFRPPVNHHRSVKVVRDENTPYEVRNTAMKPYPTPHLDKLKATLVNDKLPPGDKPQVEKAIEHYEQWIANEISTNLAYIAAECKTNLDKTMFQEACATARDLKTAIPGAKYFLLCEWLDMTPVSSRTTPIDEVLLLRGTKRISSNIRHNFSTYKGRQEAREPYLEFLNNHPYRAKFFERFLGYIRQLLKNESLDEQTVLERGYF